MGTKFETTKNSGYFRFPALLTACLLQLRLCAEPPPAPPYVAAAPDPGGWVIDVLQKKPRPAPPSDPKWLNAYKRALDIYPRIVRITSEKADGDRYEETLYENGKKGVMYIYKGWVVYRPVAWPEDKALALPVNSRYSPVKGGLGPDFADLDWIRPEVFVGTVMYEGRRCYQYEDKEGQPISGGDALDTAKTKGVRAWIDAKTLLPLAVEDDAVLKRYTYNQKAVSIQLSGVFAAAYESALAAAKGQAEPPSARH